MCAAKEELPEDIVVPQKEELKSIKVLLEDDCCTPVKISSTNILVNEFISTCHEIYKQHKGKEVTEHKGWERELFSQCKGIWLKRTNPLSMYQLDKMDILHFRSKPKLLHICLPHSKKCGVYRYTSSTLVESILTAIPSKSPSFCIPDSIVCALDLFLLCGENNRKIISEAQQSLREQPNSFLDVCCHGDDNYIALEEVDARHEEQKLFKKIFSSDALVPILHSHSERYEVTHVHPLDLLSDGLNFSDGVWLDRKKTLNEYEISQRDIVLLAINPSLCSIEPKILDNFITVFNTELGTMKRKKFIFDTTVEEYTKQLCRTFQLNPHQKEFGLFLPPVNDQIGSWLVPGSNLISCALNKNFLVEFARKQESTALPTTTVAEYIHAVCLLDEKKETILPITQYDKKYINHQSIEIGYDLDTLVIDARKEVLRYTKKKLPSNYINKITTSLYLYRQEQKEIILLKDERSLVSYSPNEQCSLILARKGDVHLTDIISVKVPSTVVLDPVQQTNQPVDSFASINFCPKIVNGNIRCKSNKTVRETVDILQSQFSLSDTPSGSNNRFHKTSAVLVQPSTTDLPEEYLLSTSAKLDEYHIKAPLGISLSTPFILATREVTIQLDFLDTDPFFMKVLRQPLEEGALSHFIKVEYSNHTTVRQVLEFIIHQIGCQNQMRSMLISRMIDGISLYKTMKLANEKEKTFPMQASRLLSSYGLASNESLLCSRKPFKVRTILRLTSFQSHESSNHMIFHKQTPQVANSRISTITLSSILVTPKELINYLMRETDEEMEALQNYYGVYLIKENRWLDSLASFLENNVESNSFLDVKIKPENMQVIYTDLATENATQVKISIDVDYTIPINEIIFSQLLGTLHCNRRDIMEVRLLEGLAESDDEDEDEEKLTSDDEVDIGEASKREKKGKDEEEEEEPEEEKEEGAGEGAENGEGEQKIKKDSMQVKTWQSHTRSGRLLKKEESLAMQGITPAEYRLYIFRLDVGNTRTEMNEDVDTNIWEAGGQNDIIIGTNSEHKKVVLAGTLNKLIEYLTTNSRTDQLFLITFMQTYPMFTSSEMVFKKFMQRFNVPKPVDLDHQEFVNTRQLPIRLRVVSAMKHWVEYCGATFDVDLLNSIHMFISNCVDQEGLPQVGSILRTSLNKVQSGITVTKGKQAQSFSNTPIARIQKKDFSTPVKFTDFDDEEIAKQLSLIAHKLFCSVKSTEFLNQAWTKAKYHYRCPNLLAAIERFNTESQWVSTMIINVPTTKARAKVMSKFINIAKYLKIFHNYNSLMAFIAALNTAAVSRLKWTKKELSKKTQDTLLDLEKFLSNELNYKSYRNVVSEVNEACVPYLGVHLSDLIFIEEGNSKYIENTNLVNFEMCQQVSDVITLMQKLQGVPYTAKPVPELMVLLTDLPVMNEKPLYQLSLKREPRGKVPPDLEKDSAGWDKKIGGFLRHDKDK